MPEGPEVKATADILDFLLRGGWLESVTTLPGGKYSSKNPQGFEAFSLQLPMRVRSVECYGKMLIFSFNNPRNGAIPMKIFAGLGMTGQFYFHLRDGEASHASLKFSFSPGASGFPLEGTRQIYFVDPRHFGNVYFSADDLNKKLAPSLLHDCTQEEFLKRAAKKKTSKDVVTVLMDQQAICSGIGNYMVAEILYRAKVSPQRKFSSLSLEELQGIFSAAKEVAFTSYSHQGNSISDFYTPLREKGAYGKLLQVYGMKVDPHGNPIQRSTYGSGRTVWWVPQVQH